MKAPLVIFPAILWLAGCSESPRNVEANGALVPVKVVTVTAEPWPEEYEAMGTVRARMAAVLSSKVMGYVREVHANIGDRVGEGQLLVVLDAADLEANYRRADAGREEARSTIPEAENGVAAAKANRELAQSTFKRMSDLFASKSISNQEYDQAAARLKAAEAAHAMAESKRTQLTSKIARADQERRAAEIQRGYAELRAPFAGVVTAKSVEPGNLATPGAPLLTIERDGQYRLEVPVEESRLALIRSGSKVTVMLDALGRSFDATISEVTPSVDAASRAYLVKIDLPAIPHLRSGLFGRARLVVGRRPVLSVPASAVMERGQVQSVFVVENGAARLRLITIGRKMADRAEVLSGLNAGDQALSPIPVGLADGSKVEIRQ
ncbi:MAG: efflux RND transporter periplasmic adaptor subunit [Verrucomicrobia bacterium]|nr:MAG: efflux RND transporter periplasmic adaptor subunit [Verrucomicrobiota bacterium]